MAIEASVQCSYRGSVGDKNKERRLLFRVGLAYLVVERSPVLDRFASSVRL